MKILNTTLVVVLPLAITAMCQEHAPRVPANEAQNAGMTNLGEVLLPPIVLGGQYSASIDPTIGFGYFGPSHSPILSTIDLNGALPKVTQSALPNSMPKDVPSLSTLLVDFSDPDPHKHYIYAVGGGQVLKMVPGDALHASHVVATLRPTSSNMAGLGMIDTRDSDPSMHYAYFLSDNASKQRKVLRVRLSDFTDQGSETLQVDRVRYGGIDTVRHYVYFTSVGSRQKPNIPLQICKVNLATFHDGGRSVATYTMDSTNPGDGIGRIGFDNPNVDVGFVIDEIHGYAYFGTYNYAQGGSQSESWPYNQSEIVRMKLTESDAFPTHSLETLDLRVGERNLSASVIDTTHGNVYFGTDNTYPAHVFMIHVGDGTQAMREVGRLDLKSGSIPLKDLPPDGNTLSATPEQHGEVFLRSAILDARHNAIYFGTDSQPGQIIKVGINRNLPVALDFGITPAYNFTPDGMRDFDGLR